MIEELARDRLGFERLRPGQLSEKWGEGTVQRYDGDSVTVLSDEHGYRELYLPVVRDRGLLRPALDR